ncbi:Gfo/Idh/MocA family oxidoreductase [Arenibacter sp. S6351L]|uniref:Gfo/Idh/MocA family protein n=1 Tax=Arenibacter sp. S6351L TaxID=2926407 RepID=UPI001FF399C6|nr:Gfo/Idh/MocA family oxidoreductase [Arenibacter sp. S6351L]MCK0136069.1 Gfo/Idh/MocA family oxidoreductase [Arenibacter sp. S6351L]
MERKRRNFIKTTAMAGLGLSITGNIGSMYGTESKNLGLKIGIIGLDTSHVIAFTKSINHSGRPEFHGAKVVAAYPTKGSADLPDSIDRLNKFTDEIREIGIEIVNSIDELLKKVDAVLLESVDARRHLKEALPVLKAGKRMFIDKPISNSLENALAIFKASQKYKVPIFSASSTRFSPESLEIARGNKDVGNVLGAYTYCSAKKAIGHLDLAYYGIHGIEALFTLMGPGCNQVTRVDTPVSTVVTGVWEDGRIGVFTATPEGGKATFGGLVHGSTGVKANIEISGGYDPLLIEIIKYFRTGVTPVSNVETLEIFAFMKAADESKLRGGLSVSLAEMMKKATVGSKK